jgi:hypothetical protein
VPFVNWTMMLFTIALTVGFGSSGRLAGAYGHLDHDAADDGSALQGNA